MMTNPRARAAVGTAALACLIAPPWSATASNHREAPITALDHKADITDIYAFVSYTPDQVPNTVPARAWASSPAR